MTVNARTLAAVKRMRLELDQYVDAATRDLAKAWSAAWQEVTSEWIAAVDELIDIGEGDWPTKAQTLRAQRAQNAMKLSVDAIRDLAKYAGVRIVEDAATLTGDAATWQETIFRTQLPAGQPAVGIAWDRVDEHALKAIVKRTTQQVHSLTRPLTADAEARMKSVLIRGVAVGDNPRAAARQILKRVNGAFDGGLARATNIASTELLDAHRYGAQVARTANADVLAGWQWLCTLDKRTCPSCLSQNGSTHPVGEFGPQDHQRGRCTAVPVSKTWRQLGIDLDSPPSTFPDAKEWFDKQPRTAQQEIMGAERLKQYQAGTLRWHEMGHKVTTPGWRDSYRVRPLHSL